MGKQRYARVEALFARAITPRRVKGFESYIKAGLRRTPEDTQTVCWDSLVVASAHNLFRDLDSHGLSLELWEYRKAVLAAAGLWPAPPTVENSAPTKNQIIILRKENSILRSYTLGKSRTHWHDIYNPEEIKDHLSQTFPLMNVSIVSPRLDRPIAEELRLLSKARIVISPSGGISTLLAFLRPGSCVVLMDYFVDEQESLGYQLGDSASMEVGFWNAWTHIDKVFYQVYSKDGGELVWDDPSFSSGTRKRASVRVDKDRIESIVRDFLQKRVFLD